MEVINTYASSGCCAIVHTNSAHTMIKRDLFLAVNFNLLFEVKARRLTNKLI